MKLDDTMSKSEDDFTVVLNYMDRYTFTQTSCLLGGHPKILYSVHTGNSKIHIVTEASDPRQQIFEKLDAFLENMHANEDFEDQYSAIVRFVPDADKLIPLYCLARNSAEADSGTFVVQFGNSQSVMEYGCIDLNAKVLKCVNEKVDLNRFGEWLSISCEEEIDQHGDAESAG